MPRNFFGTPSAVRPPPSPSAPPQRVSAYTPQNDIQVKYSTQLAVAANRQCALLCLVVPLALHPQALELSEQFTRLNVDRLLVLRSRSEEKYNKDELVPSSAIERHKFTNMNSESQVQEGWCHTKQSGRGRNVERL